MVSRIQLGDLGVDVTRKDIKNVHLSVHPPTGRVSISAPSHMDLDRVRLFAISKLDWIKSQQKKVRSQERETPREYLERESHYLWGKRYLLEISKLNEPPSVQLVRNRIKLTVRPGTNLQKREMILEEWFRVELKEAIPPLIKKWQKLLGVEVDTFYVRRMKTKWGSCSPGRRTIRLNTELVKKPKECLEYLVVHEMVHLLEPTHNKRFVSLMDHYFHHWREVRDLLNSLPVRHETWRY